MKKIFVFIFSFSLILSTLLFSASAEASTYDIADIAGKYKTQGRTDIVDDALYIDWSASGIEFNANCSGDVSVTFDAKRLSTNDTGGIYFTVVIDGVVQHSDMRAPSNNSASSWQSNSTYYPFHITKTGTSSFIIAKNLKPGIHKFEIYNQSEATYTSFGIKSISLNGSLVDPPKNNNLLIEFIGDSITASYGNLSTSTHNGAALYQDATRGFPYLTAKQLHADWSVIAQSGITASNGIGWAGSGSVSMQTIYPKSRYFSDSIKQYDFSRPSDFVIVGLGTNDYWTYRSGNKTENYLKEEFVNLIKLIRDKSPKSKIIWIYGMMINEGNILIPNMIEEIGGASKGYYSLQLPRNISGGQGHPNLEIQQIYADTLSKFITDILNGKVVNGNTNTSSNLQSKPNNAVTSPTVSDNTNSAQDNNTVTNTSSSNSTSDVDTDTSNTTSKNEVDSDSATNKGGGNTQLTTTVIIAIVGLLLIVGVVLLILLRKKLI